jgi:hypothetical protein
MSIDSWRTWSGIAVLIAGLAAAVTMSNEGGEAGDEPVTASSLTPIPTTSETARELIQPRLPGVSDPVARVLQWSGHAGFADQSINSQIPSVVVEALVAYGVPIAVPSPETSN